MEFHVVGESKDAPNARLENGVLMHTDEISMRGYKVSASAGPRK